MAEYTIPLPTARVNRPGTKRPASERGSGGASTGGVEPCPERGCRAFGSTRWREAMVSARRHLAPVEPVRPRRGPRQARETDGAPAPEWLACLWPAVEPADLADGELRRARPLTVVVVVDEQRAIALAIDVAATGAGVAACASHQLRAAARGHRHAGSVDVGARDGVRAADHDPIRASTPRQQKSKLTNR